MKNIINDITQRIESAWRQKAYAMNAFENITYDVLADYDLSAFYSYDQAFTLVMDPSLSAMQTPSEFSELNLKVFDNGKFFVEILHWFDRDTAIHDHNFSGVLAQLHGKSLNLSYSFREMEQDGDDLVFGELSLATVEILKPGVLRRIPLGRSDAHAVYHLDEPTISLIVRTHGLPEYSPQLNYFIPNLRANYDRVDNSLQKKIRSILLAHRVDPEMCKRWFSELLASQSLGANLWTLFKLSAIAFSPTYLPILQQYLSSNEAETSKRETVVKAAAHMRAQNHLMNTLKSKLSDSEDLLALSLIATSGSRNDLLRALELLKSMNPDYQSFRLDRQILSLMEKLSEHDRNLLQKYSDGLQNKE